MPLAANGQLSHSAPRAPGLSALKIAAVLLLGVTVWLLRSFLVPLIWATILAIANWPLYRRALKIFPAWMRPNLIPLLLSALITALILGPIIFACSMLLDQAHAWAVQLAAADQHGLTAPSWLQEIPLMGTRLAEDWNSAAGTPGGLSSWIRRVDSSSMLRWLQSVGQLVAYHTFVAAVTVVVLFFLFRQGELFEIRLASAIRRRFGETGTAYANLAVAALRATLHSMVLIGLGDGIVLGIAYALARVPSYIAWGAVTGLLAMFPFVGYIAVAAVCAGLIGRHADGAAIVIGLIGFAVLFTNDKFVRPTLMAQGARLDFIGALMGTIGGLQTFGLVGVFIGPVVVALGRAVCREWLQISARSSGR